MSTFLLVRHGETDAVGRTLSGRSLGVPLTKAGREQVRHLLPVLRGEKAKSILTSPLERCQQTAELIAAGLEVSFQACDELTEVDFGAWTGWSFRELEGEPAWRQFNRLRALSKAPGGECLLDVQHRVLRLIHRLSRERPDNILILVTHADVIRAALCGILSIPLDSIERLQVEPASVSKLEMSEDYARVISVNVDPRVVLSVQAQTGTAFERRTSSHH